MPEVKQRVLPQRCVKREVDVGLDNLLLEASLESCSTSAIAGSGDAMLEVQALNSQPICNRPIPWVAGQNTPRDAEGVCALCV